jgi:hypothetical protein
MEKDELKKYLDKVYAVGFKNGQIEMRNRVLMKLNRDVNFWTSVKNADFLMTLLKKINKLPLTKDITKIKY